MHADGGKESGVPLFGRTESQVYKFPAGGCLDSSHNGGSRTLKGLYSGPRGSLQGEEGELHGSPQLPQEQERQATLLDGDDARYVPTM